MKLCIETMGCHCCTKTASVLMVPTCFLVCDVDIHTKSCIKQAIHSKVTYTPPVLSSDTPKNGAGATLTDIQFHCAASVQKEQAIRVTTRPGDTKIAKDQRSMAVSGFNAWCF